MLSPKNIDTPNMKIFLDEFRSTNCRLDKPTAVTMPVIYIELVKIFETFSSNIGLSELKYNAKNENNEFTNNVDPFEAAHLELP